MFIWIWIRFRVDNRSGSTHNPSRPWSNFIVIAIIKVHFAVVQTIFIFFFYPKFFFFLFFKVSITLAVIYYSTFIYYFAYSYVSHAWSQQYTKNVFSRDLHTMLQCICCKYGSSKNFYSLVRSILSPLNLLWKGGAKLRGFLLKCPATEIRSPWTVVNSTESISTELYLFLTSYLITRW